MVSINNYFTGKLREFYLTKGSQDQFGLQNIPSAARNVLQAKLVEWTQGKAKLFEWTQGKAKFFTSRKSIYLQFYSFFGLNIQKENAIFVLKSATLTSNLESERE